MSVVSLYTNQTAVLHKYIGAKDNGQPIFASAMKIHVRFEEKRSLVRDAKGEEVVSEAFVMTMERLSEGDILEYGGKKWTVLRVSAPVGLSGKVMHYEGWL